MQSWVSDHRKEQWTCLHSNTVPNSLWAVDSAVHREVFSPRLEAMKRHSLPRSLLHWKNKSIIIIKQKNKQINFKIKTFCANLSPSLFRKLIFSVTIIFVFFLTWVYFIFCSTICIWFQCRLGSVSVSRVFLIYHT
jgi:hypothetical protein